MQYRRFGRTELQMPVFSCGGMRYQQYWTDIKPWTAPWKISRANQTNLEATIRRSLEVGINHIETARGYGTSELQLGRILPKLPRDRMIVQTKISPIADAHEFEATLNRCLDRLKLDYIDLLGLHGVNTPELLELCLRPGGCLDVVRRLQQQGRVRFVGFSTHGPTDVIVQAIETNQFDYVNLHWYYIFQDNWAAIAAATRHDMGVFIISPSDKGGMLYKPPQRLVDLCAPLSPMVFNDLFCLSHPQVHTLSIGAAKPDDFDEHLKTLDYLERADEVLPPILARLEQAACERLGGHWYKTWRDGLPNWTDTPGQVNLQAILWLRNLALAYDMTEYASMRYNLLGNGGHWFPGQPAKNLDLEALRDCLQQSPHRDVIPQRLQETEQLLGGAEVQRLSQQGQPASLTSRIKRILKPLLRR